MGFGWLAVHLLDESSGTLERFFGRGRHHHLEESAADAARAARLDWCDTRGESPPGALRRREEAALLSVPVVVERQIQGVLVAARTGDPGAFAAEEVDVVNFIATQLALVTERHDLVERLRRMALYDPLTGLANRSLLYDRMEQSLARAVREAQGVSVLFIDVDNFKAINDWLGHRAGDEILQSLAQRLEGSVRKCDTIARLGGDEFVVIIDGARTREAGRRVADKILGCFREPVVAGGQSVRVSLSIGISQFPDDGRDRETLIRMADRNMYCAKETGGGIADDGRSTGTA